MKEFKIRASACGQIMAYTGLTDAQEEKLCELQKKENTTEKQKATIAELLKKKNNPELPQGAKTYCQIWLKEQLYNRKKEFSTKYTQKGNIVEDNSLDFIAERLGLGMLLKNEQHYENSHMTGTPDVVLPDYLIDAKNAWDCFTMPIFDTEVTNTDYIWQAQVYMELTGVHRFKLIYVLSDTPINLIEREAYYYAKANGYEDVDTELYNEFLAKMTYGDVRNELKIKIFNIDYDAEMVKRIYERVDQCREYIKTIWNEPQS